MSARDLLATEARLAVALRQAPTNQEAAAALSTVSQYAALVNQTQDEQSSSVLNDPTVAACRSALLWSQSATVLSDGASTLSQCCVGAATVAREDPTVAHRLLADASACARACLDAAAAAPFAAATVRGFGGIAAHARSEIGRLGDEARDDAVARAGGVHRAGSTESLERPSPRAGASSGSGSRATRSRSPCDSKTWLTRSGPGGSPSP